MKELKHMSENTPFVSREIMNNFMSRVDQKSGKDGCWTWTGTVHKNHGNIPSFSYTENKKQKNQPARAFIVQRTTGNLPTVHSEKMSYKPGCGNPLCVKPSHIKVVPMRDMMLALKERAANKLKSVTVASVNNTNEVPTTLIAPVAMTSPTLVTTPETAVATAQKMVSEYTSKNPLQFLVAPIKEAITRQKQRIEITKGLVAELEKELGLFENELKRVENK